jgi:hypothetical protein
MTLDPEIWGPHFWFVLHTIALMYPKTPNETMRKKYYELIQNVPLYLPSQPLGDLFSSLLDKYPVTPYLDTQESFFKWVHFMYNKMNVLLGSPEVEMKDFINNYHVQYIPKEVAKKQDSSLRHNVALGGVVAALTILICVLYRK